MEYIGRMEHEEFAKRMEEEHNRQNKRIKDVEDEIKQINSIAMSVK